MSATSSLSETGRASCWSTYSWFTASTLLCTISANTGYWVCIASMTPMLVASSSGTSTLICPSSASSRAAANNKTVTIMCAESGLAWTSNHLLPVRYNLRRFNRAKPPDWAEVHLYQICADQCQTSPPVQPLPTTTSTNIKSGLGDYRKWRVLKGETKEGAERTRTVRRAGNFMAWV